MDGELAYVVIIPNEGMIWINAEWSIKSYYFFAEKEGSRRTIMKTIAYVLIALSVLAGVATTVTAFDAKTFYEQMERETGN
jgi:hypothetical protein